MSVQEAEIGTDVNEEEQGALTEEDGLEMFSGQEEEYVEEVEDSKEGVVDDKPDTDDIPTVDDESGGEEEEEEVDQVALSHERDDLLIRGAQLGLTGEQLRAFNDNGTLRASLDMVEYMKPKDTDEGAKTAEEEVPAEWNTLPENLEELVDDPDTVALLKGMDEGTKKAVTEMMNNQIGVMQKQFSIQIDPLHKEIFAERSNVLDETLSGMGEEWAAQFGTGSGSELDSNSQQYKNRSQIFDEAMSGRFKGSFAKRVEAAAQAMNPDIVKKAAKNSVVQKARDRNGKFITKPSSRKGIAAEMSPNQRAVNAVNKLLNRSGGEDNSGDDDQSGFGGF